MVEEGRRDMGGEKADTVAEDCVARRWRIERVGGRGPGKIILSGKVRAQEGEDCSVVDSFTPPTAVGQKKKKGN